MLNLISSTSLRLVTTLAGSVSVTGSFVDIASPGDGSGASPYSVGSVTLAAITTATTTPIVSAPAAGFGRNVEQLTLKNNSTNAHPLRVEQFNGTAAVTIWEGTLQGKGWVSLDETGEWKVYDSTTGTSAGGSGSSDWASITGKPTTRTGFGLTDVPTTTEVDDAIALALTNSGMQLIPITSANLSTLRTAIIADPFQAPPMGTSYLLTTGPFINRVVRWNGFSFKPDDGLSQYAAVGSFLGAEKISNNTASDTTTTELFKVTLPGWLMGPHTLIRIFAMFNQDNANAGTRIIGAQVGSIAEGYTVVGALPSLTGANLAYSLKAEVANSGNLANQVCVGNQTYGNAASFQNLTKNTAIDFDVRFTGQWTTQQTPAVSIISLRGFSLEFIG